MPGFFSKPGMQDIFMKLFRNCSAIPCHFDEQQRGEIFSHCKISQSLGFDKLNHLLLRNDKMGVVCGLKIFYPVEKAVTVFYRYFL